MAIADGTRIFMGDNLASLLIAASIAMATWGIGRPAARIFRLDRAGDLAMIAWSIGLGVVALSGLLWLAACLQCFTGELLACATLLAATWGVWECVCAFARPKAAVVVMLSDDSACLPAILPGVRRQSLCAWAMVVLCAALSLVAALAPPTSPAVIARLEPAKELVLAHGCSLAEKQFPNITDLWFAWALALDGPVAANLIQWLSGLFVALATALLAQILLGAPYASLAATLALLTPGIQARMMGPCDGLAGAAFAALAFSGWWLARIEAADRRWLIVTGLFAVAALASGKAAVPVLMGAAATAAYVNWRHKAGDFVVASSMAGLLMLGLGGLALCCFGGLPDGWFRARPVAILEAVGLLGPLFVATLPALWICRRLRGLGPLLAICAWSTVLGLSVYERALWAVALVPALAIAAVWVWLELDRLGNSFRYSARILLGALAVASACPLLTGAASAVAVASGYESREEYLLRKCPGYELTLLASHFISPHDHLLAGPAPVGYLACRITSDPRLSRGMVAPATDSVSRQQKLRKMGFTHVLVPEPPAQLSSDDAASGGADGRAAPRVQIREDVTEIALGRTVSGQSFRLLILR